tara:strand:+ start:830 stop:1072 length:243 start_codon:yes stop_codon:yes gene_type:complete
MNCERPFFCSGQGRGTYCDGSPHDWKPVEGFRMLPDNEQIKKLGSKPFQQKDLNKLIEITEKISENLIILIEVIKSIEKP